MGKISQGSGTGKIAPNADLQNLFKQIIGQTGPARKLQFQQLTEALQTGGVGARIPIIQRAVEAQMAADSQSATQGRETTARAGLAGSPFDVATQMGQASAAKSREAAIGPSMAAGMIAGAPSQIEGATNQAMNLGSLDQQRQEWNSKVLGGFLENLRQSTAAMEGGGGASSGGGGDPTAASFSTGSGAGYSGSNVQGYPSGSEMLSPGGSPETSSVSGGAGSHWWSSIFS